MLPTGKRLESQGASLIVLALALCLLDAGPSRASEELYRRVVPSTAVIYKSQGPFFGAGTGFLVDAEERLLVTARHVVENASGGIAPAAHVIFAQTAGGEVIAEASYYRNNWQKLAVKGKVVYESVRCDMAILQLEKLPPGVKALPLAASKARPGQLIHQVGNSGDRFGALFSYCQGHVRSAFYWEEMGAAVVASQAATMLGLLKPRNSTRLPGTTRKSSVSTCASWLAHANSSE